MTKANFIICAPLHLTFKSSRALALVELARSIEKAGRTAHLCATMQAGGQHTAYRIDFDTYTPVNDAEREFVAILQRVQREFGVRLLKDFSPQHLDASYVVYADRLTGNPLDAKHVIRYVQNKADPRTGTQLHAGPDDFIVAQSRVMHAAAHHVCFFGPLDPVFHKRGAQATEERTLDVTYLGGGILSSVDDTLPETVGISRTNPATREELATLLRNTRFFYTANPGSQINAEALACGAIPAFLDNGPFAHEEIDAFEPGPIPRLYEGIQTGETFYADFESAREAYLERLNACHAGWDASVAQLIAKADAHFAAALSASIPIADTSTAPAGRAGPSERHWTPAELMSGGTFNGYTIRQVAEHHYVATLAGVDPALLSPKEERVPVQFVARSQETLQARLAIFLAELAQTPTAS